MEIGLGIVAGILAFIAAVSIIITLMRRSVQPVVARTLGPQTRRPAPPCRIVPVGMPVPRTEGWTSFTQKLIQDPHVHIKTNPQMKSEIRNEINKLTSELAALRKRYTLKSRRK